MPDKTLVCKDCSKEFVFTEGEQEFLQGKGFDQRTPALPGLPQGQAAVQPQQISTRLLLS